LLELFENEQFVYVYDVEFGVVRTLVFFTACFSDENAITAHFRNVGVNMSGL